MAKFAEIVIAEVHFGEYTARKVRDVCLHSRNWWRIFPGGVHTQQGNRPFLRPTPTPQHKRTVAPPMGLRPEQDHQPRYRGGRFTLG
jgi:hypothetical protein